MYLIAGLGNPEQDYSKTRHNMGFDTINKIAKQNNIQINKIGFEGIYGKGEICSKSAILLKPQTYMNLSGISISKIMNFYKIDPQNLIVIYDDMDIEIGKIKLRKKGGPGTHNGMKSVVSELNRAEFTRIRVGIGKPKYKNDMINYVLGHIPNEEWDELDKATTLAADAVCEIIQNGIDTAMNKYN